MIQRCNFPAAANVITAAWQNVTACLLVQNIHLRQHNSTFIHLRTMDDGFEVWSSCSCYNLKSSRKLQSLYLLTMAADRWCKCCPKSCEDLEWRIGMFELMDTVEVRQLCPLHIARETVGSVIEHLDHCDRMTFCFCFGFFYTELSFFVVASLWKTNSGMSFDFSRKLVM